MPPASRHPSAAVSALDQTEAITWSDSLFVKRYPHYRQRRRQQSIGLGLAVFAVFIILVSSAAIPKAFSTLIPKTVPTIALPKLSAPSFFKHKPWYRQPKAQAPAVILASQAYGPQLAWTLSEVSSVIDQPLSKAQKPLIPATEMAKDEDTVLKQRFKAMLAPFEDRFQPHLFFLDPQTGHYVNIRGDEPVPAASVIKLPVLLQYAFARSRAQIAPDTPLLFAEHHRASGAGMLQYQGANQLLSAHQIAHCMITISDNTCTNMLLEAFSPLRQPDRFAGFNQILEQQGLHQTAVHNWLPDLEGTNTISPADMVTLLMNLDLNPAFTPEARAEALEILKQTHNRRLLPAQLPPEAVIAHKTGDIGTALGDSAIVYLPDGRRFYLSVQVERPYNDYAIRDTMQAMARLAYERVESFVQ